MSDPPRAASPHTVDLNAELSAFAESAVLYHGNRRAFERGAAVEALIEQAFQRAAAVADRAEARAQAAHATACNRGCAWCCHQNVRVSAAEVFRLVRWMRAHFSAAELAAIAARARETAARLAGMPQPERARARIACALLDPVTGACRVHEARPLLCRGQLSVSAQTCQRAVESPDRNRFEPLLDAIHGAGLASMSLELEFAFLGGGAVSGELTAMMAVVLSDPAGEAKWSGGENPFPQHDEFSTHLNSRMAQMLAAAWARLAAEGGDAADASNIRSAAMRFLKRATGANEPRD